jgi:hypothetical protein
LLSGHGAFAAQLRHAVQTPRRDPVRRYDPVLFGSDRGPATARIVAKKFKEGGERPDVWEYVADIAAGPC